MSPAEMHVDWAAHNAHIVEQRGKVEQACKPATRRLALFASQQHGISNLNALQVLTGTLELQLERTAKFGFASTQTELANLRVSRDHTATAGLVIPDAGRFGQLAARGLTGVATLVSRRALETATAVAQAVTDAVQAAVAAGEDAFVAAQTAAARALHNHALELVGETLNLGRTAGALSLPMIPEFALRSEQLDRNTCEPCDELHGMIVQVGTPQYWAILPPIGCLGGGRCRGVMVFGDGRRDVAVPEQLAA